MVERVRLKQPSVDIVEINPRLLRERPAHVSLAIECKFCGHRYLQPCDEVKQKLCPNVKLKPKVKNANKDKKPTRNKPVHKGRKARK